MLSNRLQDLPPSKKKVYRSVVETLQEGDKTGSQISAILGIPVPSLSRILVDLQKEGILDQTPPGKRKPRVWRIGDVTKIKALD